MPLFTEEQKEFIKNNVVGTPNKELVALLNKKFGTNFSKTQIISFKKYNDIRSGLGNGFPFKKEIGAELINKSGFILIKTKNGWEYKQRVIWEKHFGKIPKDKVIIFLDRNRLNCDIENLFCVDKKVCCSLNTNKVFKNRANADVAKVCIALAALKFRIKELEQKNEDKKGETR